VLPMVLFFPVALMLASQGSLRGLVSTSPAGEGVWGTSTDIPPCLSRCPNIQGVTREMAPCYSASILVWQGSKLQTNSIDNNPRDCIATCDTAVIEVLKSTASKCHKNYPSRPEMRQLLCQKERRGQSTGLSAATIEDYYDNADAHCVLGCERAFCILDESTESTQQDCPYIERWVNGGCMNSCSAAVRQKFVEIASSQQCAPKDCVVEYRGDYGECRPQGSSSSSSSSSSISCEKKGREYRITERSNHLGTCPVPDQESVPLNEWAREDSTPCVCPTRPPECVCQLVNFRMHRLCGVFNSVDPILCQTNNPFDIGSTFQEERCILGNEPTYECPFARFGNRRCSLQSELDSWCIRRSRSGVIGADASWGQPLSPLWSQSHNPHHNHSDNNATITSKVWADFLEIARHV